MKFVVGKPKPEVEEDTKVFFWLEEDDDGDITLKAVREDSDDDYGWNILYINPSGLNLIPGVINDLGFPIDSTGRIVLKE